MDQTSCTMPSPTVPRLPRWAIMLITVMCILGTSLAAFSLTQGSQTTHAQAPSNGNMPVGLNVDINEQALVDLIVNNPRIQQVGSTTLSEDSNGWPSSDFEWVFDNRFALAWVSGATNVDPQKKSTDLAGTYTLTFTGQATLTANNGGDPAHAATTIGSQSYDASSNTTTAQVTFGNPAGGLISVLQFSATKRNASDTAGDGVTNLHLWRPGYTPGTSQVFTDLWLNSIKNYNWSALRLMGALGTNDYAGPSTPEVYPYRLNWSTDRLQPGKGPLYSANHVGVHGGISWEGVVLLTQLTHKDIWINIPVNASDDYVNQLANLLKNGNQYTNNQGIPNDVNVYVEYSNEMWHYGFNQGPWNNQAAKDEVAAGGSNLNYDNCNNNNDCWRFRRIAKRTIEIGNQMKQAFGDNGTRIRPVINNAFVGNDPDILRYVNDNYGAPSGVLYGISQTGYYNSTDRSSVQSILNTMQTSSDNNVSSYVQSRAIATYYGLHSLTYEAGEGDTGDSNDQNLYNQFAATRDPGMQGVEMHDLNNWYSSGGEMYMQFAHVGRYSIYGFWGLSDDMNIQNSGKWNGMIQAMNTAKPAFSAGTAIAGSGATSLSTTKDVFGNDFSRPNTGSSAYYLLNAAQAGTYDISITTNASGPGNGGIGQAKVYVNNQEVGGVMNMPASSTIDFGSVHLQAGANTLYIYAVHGSFDPAYPNDVFHDQWQPVNAVFTAQSVQSGWTKCADENGVCNFSGTMVVRYGANGHYNYQTATNSINCNNATFGDPIVGTYKACYTAPVPPTSWTKCSDENGTCTVSGTVTVAYGANGKFVYHTVTGSTACNNATFGDPIVGTFKACYYQ